MKTSNKLTLMIAVLLSLLSNSDVHAATSCEQLGTAFRERYFRQFNFDQNLSTFDCNGATGKIVQTIWDLETLKFQANPGGAKPDFYKFFYDVVQSLSYTEQGRCAGGRIIAFSSSNPTENGGRITFCPAFLRNSREDRLMTMIHEAKHLYNDDARHVTCEAGPWAGAAGVCDDTLNLENMSVGGSNGMMLFFAHWLLISATDSDLDMAAIKSTALGIFKTQFNNYSTPKGLFSARDIYSNRFTVNGYYVSPEAAFDWIIKDRSASWLND